MPASLPGLERSRPAPAADDVVGVRVTVAMAGRRVFELAWRSDGTVCRIGSGRDEQADGEPHTRRVHPQLFESVRQHIVPELLRYGGRFADHGAQGDRCELNIALMQRQGADWTSAWQYGSETAGPPTVVRQFVNALVQLSTSYCNMRDW